MINDIVSNASMTLLITYAVNKAIKGTPLVSNRWLPMITMVTGLITGVIIALLFDTPHIQQNIMAGILGGSLSTWLDEFITRTFFHMEDNK